jgi:hypothetical protein
MARRTRGRMGKRWRSCRCSEEEEHNARAQSTQRKRGGDVRNKRGGDCGYESVEILRLGAATLGTQDDNHFKTLFSKAGVVGRGSDFAEGLAGYVLCGVRIGR